MSRTAVIVMMLVLFVLHQDFWLKDNGSLVAGIVPIGLAYHMAFTALAASAWFIVVRFAWPDFGDEEEDEGAEQ